MSGHREQSGWFTRRDGVVRGPLSADLVTRYLLLGRIRLHDELSCDAETWCSASELDELLPEELRDLRSWDDYEQLIEARRQADERVMDRRRVSEGTVHRTGVDRRHLYDRRNQHRSLLEFRQLRNLWQARNGAGERFRVHPIMLTLVFALLLVSWLVSAGRL